MSKLDTILENVTVDNLLEFKEDMFAAMTYFDGKSDFEEFFLNEDAEEIYTNLIIENLIPADIKSMSIEKLIEIKKLLTDFLSVTFYLLKFPVFKNFNRFNFYRVNRR